MPAVAVIPARYASSRFPGKPLAAETGKPLIQHVYEAVAGARLIERIIVATDDDRIAAAVRAFGGEVAMTRPDHPSGTDRVAEVVARFAEDGRPGPKTGAAIDVVVNVQGDEPAMDPGAIDKLVSIMRARPAVNMGSIACPFKNEADVLNPACVKVVLDRQGDALYFSRSLIPYPRDVAGRPVDPGKWLLHLGIYAYRPAFLQRLTATPPCDLERTEQLEQLRALWLGERIAIAVVPDKSAGIDTPEQYAAFVQRHRRASAR